MATIKATARRAARMAFKLAKENELLATVTLRLGATVGEYDPVTDTHPTTWAFDRALNTLQYDATEEKSDDEPIEKRLQAFLFLGEEMADIRGEQEGEIVTATETWQIVKTENDPTATVWVFYCRH